MSRSGDLRHRVVFRTPVSVSDGQGGKTRTYPNATVTTRCAAESLSGQEALAAGAQLTTTGLYRLVVRGNAAITVEQRADVTYSDSGRTVSLWVQRVERADDEGMMLNVYGTAVEA